MYDGIINVYKEKGFTSHDVVAKMRGILKMRKIGHTGTLDPDAEGVLPVCLGSATKLCDMITDKTKEYEAVLLLGKETDTQDISGKVLSEASVDMTEEQVQKAVYHFVGEYDQIPPMYSALKVDGKKLYELAREGKVVERKARRVEILNIDILEIKLPRVRMLVRCSKGTYIRTLCHDIGKLLQCGGCMEKLLRTRVDRFTISESLKLDEIEKLRDQGTLDDHIVTVEQVFEKIPCAWTLPEYDKLVNNGNQVKMHQIKTNVECDVQKLTDDTRIRVYNSENRFIGIYGYRTDRKWFQPVKLFISTSD